MKEIENRTDIDREVKITLLSVLQKGYFEQRDIDLLKQKVKPLENQSTIIYFENYGKDSERMFTKEEFVNEVEFPKEEIMHREIEQIDENAFDIDSPQEDTEPDDDMTF